MFAIALHGGAGTVERHLLNEEKQKQYEDGMKAAVDAGYEVLNNGGSSLDAVVAAVQSLEDCPLFNAGKGAVFNHEGRHEMDASLMNGLNREAGAVASVRNVKNPVLLAKAIMEKSEHVFMAGDGAEIFAKKHGIAFEPDEYFFDAFRYEQYKAALATDRVQLDHSVAGDRKFSTVGAVALDKYGNISAATSTGGMTNKKFGRVGDTPMIGAGTYANNETCAVSCTGHGELFIRQVVAHQVHCMMKYKGVSLEEACEQVVMKDLVEIEGEGGLIAIDTKGNIAFSFNSSGMYRGYKKSDGTEGVAIYR
ncbi:isoaspartyl peptidase/L-asparaginase [Taibaiella lutea]|uniref:Isoaspartyl peptidase n=1 Tax=Taibaiella lutea TaxID=2608001 RepID=A0A5M6CND2_9BACT|nr:isoaspartyl peptidase/L-asparaginase [Taibaiella lutea]KAA5536516.1 isoaspartyl peptidase/L-asparaginase [Taibaiella lutea]